MTELGEISTQTLGALSESELNPILSKTRVSKSALKKTEVNHQWVRRQRDSVRKEVYGHKTEKRHKWLI